VNRINSGGARTAKGYGIKTGDIMLLILSAEPSDPELLEKVKGQPVHHERMSEDDIGEIRGRCPPLHGDPNTLDLKDANNGEIANGRSPRYRLTIQTRPVSLLGRNSDPLRLLYRTPRLLFHRTI
jgi:hypothetical protein